MCAPLEPSRTPSIKLQKCITYGNSKTENRIFKRSKLHPTTEQIQQGVLPGTEATKPPTKQWPESTINNSGDLTFSNLGNLSGDIRKLQGFSLHYPKPQLKILSPSTRIAGHLSSYLGILTENPKTPKRCDIPSAVISHHKVSLSTSPLPSLSLTKTHTYSTTTSSPISNSTPPNQIQAHNSPLTPLSSISLLKPALSPPQSSENRNRSFTVQITNADHRYSINILSHGSKYLGNR